MVRIMSFCSLSTASLHYFCCLQLQKRLLLLLALPSFTAVVKLVVVVFQREEAVINVIIVADSKRAIFVGFGKSLLVFKLIACLEQIAYTFAIR